MADDGFRRPDLVCPAGTPAALRTAVDAGADAVYCGLPNATNARNFPGLNFTPEELETAIRYARVRGAKVLLAVNTFPRAGEFALWRDAVDIGARLGADALIVADLGVAEYAARSYPDLRLHLSVQAGASSPEAIRFYCEEFGIKRVVLPRILTVGEIADIHRRIPCEAEAFVFGNIGMMAEGRCSLSGYVTGISTNMDGVCSPAADVHYDEDADRNLTTRLGPFVIDRFARGESAGYPTICKGRYVCGGREEPYYAFEEPVTLNLSALLPDLVRAGVSALKIEGLQRSRAYVSAVVSAFRKAIDGLELKTMSGQVFLAVNGVQTLSQDFLSLVDPLPELRAIGVSRFRLSPHSCDMVRVAATFRAVLDETLTPGEGAAAIAELYPRGSFSYGFCDAGSVANRNYLAGGRPM